MYYDEHINTICSPGMLPNERYDNVPDSSILHFYTFVTSQKMKKCLQTNCFLHLFSTIYNDTQLHKNGKTIEKSLCHVQSRIFLNQKNVEIHVAYVITTYHSKM